MTADRSLQQRIDAAWDGLSPQEQRVADFLRTRPEESALYNSSELARLVGVSKATVSRLFRRLGFAGSAEARDLLRARRGTGMPVVVPAQGDPVAMHAARDMDHLRRFVADLDRVALDAAAAAIAAAPRVVVVGFRSAFPIAMLLRQALVQARPDVRLVPEQGQTLGEELVGSGPHDVVVLVGVRRRPAAFPRLLAELQRSPARVALLVDPSLGPSAADWRFDAPIESPSPFDSYVAAASLVSLLAGRVLQRLGDGGAARVAAIGATYRDLAELSS